MDINLFFDKMVKKLNLGNIIEEPLKVTGGLTHRMFKIVTDEGRYIVKLLNPYIMKRPTSMSNFNRADRYEEILKEKVENPFVRMFKTIIKFKKTIKNKTIDVIHINIYNGVGMIYAYLAHKLGIKNIIVQAQTK